MLTKKMLFQFFPFLIPTLEKSTILPQSSRRALCIFCRLKGALISIWQIKTYKIYNWICYVFVSLDSSSFAFDRMEEQDSETGKQTLWVLARKGCRVNEKWMVLRFRTQSISLMFNWIWSQGGWQFSNLETQCLRLRKWIRGVDFRCNWGQTDEFRLKLR